MPGIIASSPPASASASSTVIPVVACQTGSGSLFPTASSPRYPATATIAVPPSLGNRLAYYSDSARSLQPIVGPRGWSCSVGVGGDGSTGIGIFPPGGSSDSPEQVDAGSPSAVSSIYGTACPLVPHVAAEIPIIVPSSCSRPAQEAVTWYSGSPAQTSAGHDAVGFVDPPGIKGDGDPSGGAYYARGMLLYAWGGAPRVGYGASLMTCTLPGSDSDLCAAILTAFRQQSWLLSPSGGAWSGEPTGISIGKTLFYDEGDTGNCTWWAIREFQLYSGLYPDFSDPANDGDAMYWAANAAHNGWTITSTARVNSIAVFPPGANGAQSGGRVAWVTAVSGPQITISEMNFGPNVFDKVDTRTLTPASSVRYIMAP